MPKIGQKQKFVAFNWTAGATQYQVLETILYGAAVVIPGRARSGLSGPKGISSKLIK
jgi:hypothetical protein